MMHRILVPILCSMALSAAGVACRAETASWQELNQRGLTALHERNLKEAEKLFNSALSEAQKPGQDGATAAVVINNLGLLRLEQGKYAEAQDFFLTALKTFDRPAGDDNPEVPTILENLGAAYARQGKLSDAEPWLKRALAMHERSAGADNGGFVTCLTQLADVYSQQERLEDAEPLYRRALGICEESGGVDDATFTSTLDRMAEFYQAQGRYKEAGTLFDRALKTASKLSPEHTRRVLIQKHYDEFQTVKKRPNVVILRPKLGETFDDEPIFVKLAVENFELALPEQKFGEPTPKDAGHIHITLDSYPLVATVATQQMFGKTVGESHLPKGRHTLTVELVHDTHGSLTPRVMRMVTFYTGHREGKKPTASE